MAEWDKLEQRQRQRTLENILYIVAAGSFALSVVNVFVAFWPGFFSIAALSLVCGVCWWLNRNGRYRLASGLLCTTLLLVMHYNFRFGSGIRDTGIVAYACLIILGTMLFGKRTAPLFYAACFASVALLTLDHNATAIPPPTVPGIEQATKLLIILLVCSSLTYLVVANIESNVQRARQSEQEIRAAYEATLEGWARALEFRDKETEGHSRRVADMSVALARELGCSDEDIEQIRRGALLHDIGKLAIPDGILLKPDALTEDERETIRKHPEYARDFLSAIPFLDAATCIPYCHHERWDGTGYPQGLKGEEIPLYARIFAIVDQWEALGSDRPYRKGWSPEEVEEYLQKNAGTMFDPHIVPVFLRILRRKLP